MMTGHAGHTTILTALADAETALTEKNVESPRLDAEVLMAEAFGKDRTWLFARLRDPVPAATMTKFTAFINRRRDREPVAYIRGRKEFMSIEFEVTPAVLIPRPETEAICETALDYIRTLDHDSHILDLCTGSGCIAIAIAVNARKTHLRASDISDDALEVALRNARRAGVAERIEFLKGDLFGAFSGKTPHGGFDAVVANPPYVSSSEWRLLPPEACVHEPAEALKADEDGFAIIRRIVETAPEWLRPGGLLAVEMSPRQVSKAQEHACGTGGFAEIDDVRTIDGSVCGMRARRTT